MSKLNDMYQGIKRHTGKIVVGAIMVGALAGIRGCYKFMGEEVYRGSINDQEVVYEEGRFVFFETERDFIGNKMTVSKGEITYVLIDDQGENPIRWKLESAPEYNSDKLEGVAINTPSEIIKYGIHNINTETIDGVHVQEVFKNANVIYNNLRTEIRKQLRKDYQTKLSMIEERLQ